MCNTWMWQKSCWWYINDQSLVLFFRLVGHQELVSFSGFYSPECSIAMAAMPPDANAQA